jgi:hypothetical protein
MLDTALLLAQGFLGLFFLAAGLPKVVGRGIDRWVGFDGIARPLVLMVGLAEVAAAVALVVPMLIGSLEWTTPLAAIGLAVVTLMASGFHLRAGEGLPAVETALWACLAGSIAVGRWSETSTGPSLPADLLAPAVAALVAATIVNLVLLLRRPVQPRTDEREPLPVSGPPA